MAIPLAPFTPLQASLFLTLYGRALDNRSARHSMLHDRMADELVRKIDHDFGKLGVSPSGAMNIAHRAKKLDEVAQGFFARHPGAVGLDLGAGLDTRALRIDPPPTADWYDVDFPEVVAARRRLLPQRAHTHDVAADLNDHGWLDALPAGRPAVIVADGLIAFLSEEQLISLVNRLISHFPSGEIAFNGYSTFAVWASKHYPGARSIAGLTTFPGIDDPRVPEAWNPKLKLVKEILMTREPEVADFPAVIRLFTRLASLSASWSRKGNTVLHYRF
jgi:O-methyltransferase involved in polyketide biosynthesis